nr:ATP-dependent DNA helicase PIF1-like [Ipomoea batatas]
MFEQRSTFDTIMAGLEKWIALATASSGIAASIMPGGRIAHSTFKMPIDGDDTYLLWLTIGLLKALIQRLEILWTPIKFLEEKTPKSFDHIKTVNGHQAVIFCEAAENLGILSGDHIVKKCLDEAVSYQTSSSFRRLFAILLIFCDISNSHNSWDKFKSYMCEDLLKTRLHIDDKVQLMVLQIIVNVVEKMGKKIDDFNLVDNMLSLSAQEKDDREIAAEYNIQVNEYDLLCVEKLNVEQRSTFDTIMAGIISNSGGVYFIDGSGSTGKTCLYKCLLTTVRSRKWIALATASSGIAASILPGGRIAHSTFKMPIDGDDTYVCNI